MSGSLNLVTIQARNWDALLKWYCDVFGLTVVVLETADRFAMLSTGNSGAMLAIASDHPEQSATDGENRLAPGFLVADFDRTLDKLRVNGVRIDRDVDGDTDGYRLARVWDPEGNRLHLYTYG